MAVRFPKPSEIEKDTFSASISIVELSRFVEHLMDKQPTSVETIQGFICPECRSSFADADHLQEHYVKMHLYFGIRQSKNPSGTEEHRSIRSKVAAFVPGIKNAESEHCESTVRRADYSNNGSSLVSETPDEEEGTNKANECLHCDNWEKLCSEVRRLSMENEALKWHVQDAEGKCDAMKTCLSDMESSNKMLQSQLGMYKTEMGLLSDQIALKSRKVPTRDVIVGPSDVAPGLSEDHLRSIQWFYDTMDSYVSNFDSLKPLFSESPISEQPECERPVAAQNCSSIPVRELASFLISEFEFMRTKCRAFLAQAEDVPSDGESLNRMREDSPLRLLYENLENENKALQERLRHITDSVGKKDQELLEANARLGSLVKELEATSEEKSRYAQQVEELAKVNDKGYQRTKCLQEELRRSMSVNAELEKMKTEQAIAIGKMEEQLSKTTMERDEQKAEIAHLLAALDMATEKQISEKLDWENEHDRLLIELKDAMERIAYFESNIATVTEKYEEQETMLHQRIDTMTDQLVELRKEASKSRSVIEKLEEERKDACDRFNALTAETDGLKQEAKAVLRRFEDLEADYSNKAYEYDELQRKYNEVLGALQEIGLQHSHLQVDVNQLLTRRWEDDSTVASCRCGKTFSVTVRKHHCRNCGSIFCNDCSSKSAMVASSKKPVRVCDCCFEKLLAP
uniref:FYVE-type domain-containing protein n=1 Tax=Trichuris muris TaxID=70415 RepID=A0A5S6Q8D0_TRIMR